ncbi:MAG: hypothetical protein ACOY3P_22510 [Planctomycetota bacterium]
MRLRERTQGGTSFAHTAQYRRRAWRYPLIVAQLVDLTWFCFKWALVLGVVALVAAVPQLYRHVDEEIRSRIEAKLSEHYPDLKVSIRSAELVEGEGIRLRDVVIWEPGAEGPHPELVRHEEVLLVCQTTLKELLAHEPRVTRIVSRRATLRATRRPGGQWSVSKLLPLPRFGNVPIEACIEDATIEIFDPLKTPAGSLTFHGVNLRFTPPPPSQETNPSVRNLVASLSSDSVRRLEVRGALDLDAGAFSVTGVVEGLEISPEWCQALPDPLANAVRQLAGLRGLCNFSFGASGAGGGSPVQYSIAGRLEHGRLDDVRLPHPLTEMTAQFQLSHAGLQVTDLSARSNRASLKLSYWQQGFAENAPRTLVADVRQLELDRNLLMALPEPLQEHWQKYRPSGVVDVEGRMQFDGQTWLPDGTLRLQGASFTYHRFPFRLEEAKGAITLRGDEIRFGLTAYSGNQPIELKGEFQQAMTAPHGWLEAQGKALALDSKLMAALPESGRNVMQSLNPHGTTDFYFRTWREGSDATFHKHLLLSLNGCALQFDKFPYPLHEVVGELEMFDDTWTFRGLHGRNDTGSISCGGQLMPTLHGNKLELHFEGHAVPLDEELRDALRPNEKQVWMAFRPRGMVDLVADVSYTSEEKELSVKVRAQPQSDSSSIEPIHFPYRLERLRGVITYEDGRVTLEQIKAEHGAVKLSTEGVCQFLPDGRWQFRLTNLCVDRVRLDRELMQALPERLRRPLAELKPAGPINVQGVFELGSGQSPGDPIQSRWNVQLGLQQASLECGLRLHNIHGTVNIAGTFDGRKLLSSGELAIDSLNLRDFQLTEVRGPIWIDDEQVLLGSWVAWRRNTFQPQEQAEQPRSISAKLFGGTVTGDGWASFTPELRYGLQASLTGADVTRCAREAVPDAQTLRGMLSATVDLRGKGRSCNDLGGRGRIQLRDADVYDLPVMVALLKILGARVPEKGTFSHSDIEYRIAGEHVYFDRIEFAGDAMSLIGKGEMDFQQNVRMEFHALVGRSDVGLPMIKEIFAGASRQIMVIHVGGTLQNPETRREAFPGVNQALQQLQGGAPAAPPPSTADRWWRILDRK